MRQREGVGSGACGPRHPESTAAGPEIGPHTLGRTGLAQQIPQLASDPAAGDLAARWRQLATTRGAGTTEVTHGGQRVAEVSQGALDGRTHLPRVFWSCYFFLSRLASLWPAMNCLSPFWTLRVPRRNSWDPPSAPILSKRRLGAVQ